MKAVVVDIVDKYAVVLNKQGEFLKVKNNGRFQLGYEIEVPGASVYKMSDLRRVAAVAAVFILTLGLSFGVYSYNTPYSYINIDINPSVELTVNIFDRIINMEGINRDGTELLKSDSLKNKGLEDAVESILEKAVEKGYFKDDSKNAVLFTVSSKSSSKADQLGEKVENIAKEELEAESDEVQVLTEKVTVEKHDQAKEQGISPGKQQLLERLKEARPEINLEEYEDAPIKEIVDSIHAAQKEEKPDTKEKDGKDKGIKSTEDKNEPQDVKPDDQQGETQGTQTGNKGQTDSQPKKDTVKEHGNNGKNDKQEEKKAVVKSDPKDEPKKDGKENQPAVKGNGKQDNKGDKTTVKSDNENPKEEKDKTDKNNGNGSKEEGNGLVKKDKEKDNKDKESKKADAGIDGNSNADTGPFVSPKEVSSNEETKKDNGQDNKVEPVNSSGGKTEDKPGGQEDKGNVHKEKDIEKDKEKNENKQKTEDNKQEHKEDKDSNVNDNQGNGNGKGKNKK